MNAHSKPQKNSVKAAPQSVTTGPIIGSRKIYVAPPEHPQMRVPFREVVLTTDAEPPVRIYDPSGPYTETDATGSTRAASRRSQAAPSPPPTTAISARSISSRPARRSARSSRPSPARWRRNTSSPGPASSRLR